MWNTWRAGQGWDTFTSQVKWICAYLPPKWHQWLGEIWVSGCTGSGARSPGKLMKRNTLVWKKTSQRCRWMGVGWFDMEALGKIRVASQFRSIPTVYKNQRMFYNVIRAMQLWNHLNMIFLLGAKNARKAGFNNQSAHKLGNQSPNPLGLLLCSFFLCAHWDKALRLSSHLYRPCATYPSSTSSSPGFHRPWRSKRKAKSNFSSTFFDNIQAGCLSQMQVQWKSLSPWMIQVHKSSALLVQEIGAGMESVGTYGVFGWLASCSWSPLL